MADKIVVMHDGIVEQMGAPLELYDNPRNLFVASFIGSPAMNLLKGRLEGGAFALDGGARLPVGTLPPGSEGRPLTYGIRPEHFVLDNEQGAEAEVLVVEPTGSEIQVFARMSGQDVTAVFRERHDFRPGDRIRLGPDRRVTHLFDAQSGVNLTHH